MATKPKKKAPKPKAKPTKISFDDWIAQDIDTCMQSMQIDVVVREGRWGGKMVALDIGEPFDVPERPYCRSNDQPIDVLSEAAGWAPCGEHGLLVDIDSEVNEGIIEIVIDAAAKVLRAEPMLDQLRQHVHGMVQRAQWEIADEARREQERINNRVTNIIKRAGAETADIVAVGETQKGNRRFYEGNTTSYEVMAKDDDGNWHKAEGESFHTQNHVKKAFPTSVIAFRSPQGGCKLYTPAAKRPPKPTRAELEAELERLRQQVAKKGNN